MEAHISNKNQCPVVLGLNAPTYGLQAGQPGFSWQSTSPVTGFLPLDNNTAGRGSVPSGNPNGAMTGTSTIYTQIVDVGRMDNIGLEINWTGTPVGTITIQVSDSGINFYPLSSFNNTLPAPAGTAGGFPLTLTQLPFKYFFIQYVNSSGTGTLTAYGQLKDVN